MPRESARQRQYERSANRKMESSAVSFDKNRTKKLLKAARHPLVQRSMFHEMIIDPFHCRQPVVNPIVVGPPCYSRVVRDYYDWVITRVGSSNNALGSTSVFQRAAIYAPQVPVSGYTWGSFCATNGVASGLNDAQLKDSTFYSFSNPTTNTGIQRHDSTVSTELAISAGYSGAGRTNVIGVRVSALGAPSLQTGTLHVYRPRNRFKVNANENKQNSIFDNESDIEHLTSIPISKIGRDGAVTFVHRPETLDDMQLKSLSTLFGMTTTDLNWGNNDSIYTWGPDYWAPLYFFVERAAGVATALNPDSTNEVLRVEYIMCYDYIPALDVASPAKSRSGPFEIALHDPHAIHGLQTANAHEETSNSDPSVFHAKGGACGPVKDDIKKAAMDTTQSKL